MKGSMLWPNRPNSYSDKFICSLKNIIVIKGLKYHKTILLIIRFNISKEFEFINNFF